MTSAPDNPVLPTETGSLSLETLSFRPAGKLLAGDPAAMTALVNISGSLAFDLDLALEILPAAGGEPVYARHLRQDGVDISWLPRGRFEIDWHVDRLALAAGDYQARVTLYAGGMGDPRPVMNQLAGFSVGGDSPEKEMACNWQVRSAEGSTPVDSLSWKKGHEDWFFRHFDHAARTIISYMLGDSPLLKGRVLDVGCGDGITDLSVSLRCQPELLVGIDPFKGYERLLEVAAANQLPIDSLPENLQFLPADGNQIPFPDDSFDVVLSWGSLEHIAGGYGQTLLEIKRVLRDGGLLFAHPGLYYSNFGHHIGEFTDEPFVHLTHSNAEIRDIIFNQPPRYMDRAGEFSPPESYWRWYNELNPMTVSGFEAELKALDFEFYRVAIRTEDRIEYHHPALQAYSMQDLATVELYLSAFNRKPHPQADSQRDPS